MSSFIEPSRVRTHEAAAQGRGRASRKVNPESLVFAPRIDFPASREGSPITKTRCDKPWDTMLAPKRSGRLVGKAMNSHCLQAVSRCNSLAAAARVVQLLRIDLNESLVSSDFLPYYFATCNSRPIASGSSALNEKYWYGSSTTLTVPPPRRGVVLQRR